MIASSSPKALFSPLLLPSHASRQLPTVLPLRSPGASRSRVSAVYTAAPERETASAVAPMATAPAASLYEVLGLPAGASGQEIKAAYRKLARACHPDVVAVNRKDTSADQFMRIHAAYATLSDPDKRAEYDQKLLVLSRRRGLYRSYSMSSSGSSSYSPPSPGAASSPFTSSSSPPGSSFSGFTRRNWESDQCW